MRFTLVYDGPLPSQSKNNSRVEDKQRIRKQLHPQILDLWETKPMLAKQFQGWNELPDEQKQDPTWPAVKDLLIQPINRGHFLFVPLVTKKAKLTCELDILFLRAEPPGKLFTTNEAGDLDNRLKVLFDALRGPTESGDLPIGDYPSATEIPLCCLLENDDLITAVRLESERLYGSETEKNRVRLVIRATIKTQEFSWQTLDIVND
jgi:hypothetical protein